MTAITNEHDEWRVQDVDTMRNHRVTLENHLSQLNDELPSPVSALVSTHAPTLSAYEAPVRFYPFTCC
jgi:hypothetical protein